MLERQDIKQLKNGFPELYILFREVERNIGVRSDLALIKMQTIVKNVVNHISIVGEMDSTTNQLNLADQIFRLDEEELIPEDIASILNQLRIYGDKAIRTPQTDDGVTIELYERSCELLHWFLFTYEPVVTPPVPKLSMKSRNKSVYTDGVGNSHKQRNEEQRTRHLEPQPTEDISTVDLEHLTRSPFETEKEYQAKVQTLSPLQVGWISPYLAEYSIDNEVLPLKIVVMESIMKLIPFQKGYLIIDRHNARSSFPNGEAQSLYASFDVHEGELMVKSLFTRLKHKVYDIKNIIQLPSVSPADLPAVIQPLYQSASANDVNAQYDLAMYFEIEENPYLAAFWFTKAAEKRHIPSILKLGELSYKENNFQKAMELFIRAANLGSVKSKYWLGFMFEHGKGTNQNLGRAISWYEQIADTDSEAQFRLGQIHSNGAKKDVPKSMHWYKRAAAQGHGEAKKNLLMMAGNKQ